MVMFWYGSVLFYGRKYFGVRYDDRDVHTREVELSTSVIDDIVNN